MHAASVHPEPGSNSRNHCIKTSHTRWSKLCLRVLLLASFTFCLSSILIQRIFEIRFAHTLYALYFSLVVQFSKISSPLGSASLSRDLVIIPLSFRFVNTFFKTFLKSFSGLVQAFDRGAVSVTACILYYFPPFLSSTFFHFFPLFSLFGVFHSSYATSSTTFWAIISTMFQYISFFL